MTTKHQSIRSSGGLRRAGGALAVLLFAAAVQAQPQIATVISTGLLEPSSITSDPNNNIYFTDASDNRIVEFIPVSNGVFTLAGSGTTQGGYSNSLYGARAQFSQPLGIVYDQSRGGLVVVDQVNQVLRLIPITNGVAYGVSTLAGVPATWPTGDWAAPTTAPRPRPNSAFPPASQPTARETSMSPTRATTPSAASTVPTA